MTKLEKESKLLELQEHVKKAERLSNDLLGEEEHSHTKNGESLYAIRQELWSIEQRSEFIKY